MSRYTQLTREQRHRIYILKKVVQTQTQPKRKLPTHRVCINRPLAASYVVTVVGRDIGPSRPIRSCLEIRNLPQRRPNCVLPRCDGGEVRYVLGGVV